MSTIYEAWLKINDAEQKLNRTPVAWEQWRSRYGWEFAADITDRPGKVYRSSAGTTLDMYELRPPIGFSLVDEWSDGGRTIWVGRSDHVILTYCEGDLSYEECDDDESFERAFRIAEDFYR